MSDRWIVIPKWEKFQHYKDRHPSWIKLYTELMDDEDFLGLSFHQRGVLGSIWMEYARARRQLLGSTSTLSRRLGGRVTTATLEALNHAGFIEVSASKPLAHPYQPAIPEVEVEVDIDLPKKVSTANTTSDSPSRTGSTKSKGGYQQARNMTINAGWQYEPDVWHDEISKYQLTEPEKLELGNLYVQLNAAQTAANNGPVADHDLPF